MKNFQIEIKNSRQFYFEIDRLNNGDLAVDDLPLCQYQFNNYISYIQLGPMITLVCKNARLPVLRGDYFPAISRLILEALQDGNYRLHVRSISQNPEELVPAFEIIAEDFQVFRWIDDGTKDEKGFPKYPNLTEFIEWYETQVKETKTEME